MVKWKMTNEWMRKRKWKNCYLERAFFCIEFNRFFCGAKIADLKNAFRLNSLNRWSQTDRSMFKCFITFWALILHRIVFYEHHFSEKFFIVCCGIHYIIFVLYSFIFLCLFGRVFILSLRKDNTSKSKNIVLNTCSMKTSN